MAKNDSILIDGIIDDRITQKYPSDRRDEVFEFFAFEQILKNFDPSAEEIHHGWIDGRADGGVDGFFIFINGQLLKEPDVFHWPKRNAELIVYVITCKHHDTYRQPPLDNLVATISELFDFTIVSEDLKGEYSEELLNHRNLLFLAYKKLSKTLETLQFNFIYASRGNSSDLGDSVSARARQIESVAKELFSNCISEFKFIGSKELVEMNRSTKNFSLDLPYFDLLAQNENHVLLVKLNDYYKFITDENGKLRRYLFEANVRDFLGSNTVNEDIAKSLSSNNESDFWWLNNGVTILATSARAVGKVVEAEDVQIVNGLQTTESIYRHFSSHPEEKNDKRSVLVRIICSQNAGVRDDIIRATNNQSLVEPASLHATDKIQRDIEEVLLRHDYFYERRKNYYKNIGKPLGEIVSILFLAASSVSLLLKNPAHAVKVKGRHLRDLKNYDQIFNSDVDISFWPQAVKLVKRVDAFLEKKRPNDGNGSGFVQTWRSLVSYILISRYLGKFNYSIKEFLEFDLTKIEDSSLEEIWNLVLSQTKNIRAKRAKSIPFVLDCCRKAATEFSISGERIVCANKLHEYKQREERVLDEETAKKIEDSLPPQPWKVGMHIELAEKLGVQPWKIRLAVTKMIEEGRLNRQKNGVVYDSEDNIVAVDVDRQTNKAD